jgi:TatD DNase family protein
VHPWFTAHLPKNWALRLEELLQSFPGAAIGEIGLDHTLTPRTDDEQEGVFLEQLALAAQYQRPVSVHCRKAFGRLVAMLKNCGGVKYGGAMHAYSGSAELITELQSLGFYISFSGNVTNVQNKKVHRCLHVVQSDRLLIETDSPDMPAWQTPLPNRPAHCAIICSSLAQILDISPEEVAARTTDNAFDLFCPVNRQLF